MSTTEEDSKVDMHSLMSMFGLGLPVAGALAEKRRGTGDPWHRRRGGYATNGEGKRRSYIHCRQQKNPNKPRNKPYYKGDIRRDRRRWEKMKKRGVQR